MALVLTVDECHDLPLKEGRWFWTCGLCGGLLSLLACVAYCTSELTRNKSVLAMLVSVPSSMQEAVFRGFASDGRFHGPVFLSEY